MTNVTTKSDSFEPATDTAAHLFDNWFDPIEIGVRERVREFIETLIRGELDAVLARPRYGRAKNDDACPAGIVGHRHGSRTRSLTGSFGKTEITVPRARLQTSEGGTTEWHSKALRTYQRRTLTADALIAGAYLAGTNTRRVRSALAALPRRREQGHCEPGLAQDQKRLGLLEWPFAGQRADRAADPRRHRGSRPARSQVHGDLAARGHWRARRRPEGVAGG